MALLDELKELHVDVEQALSSLGGNSPLYEKLIFKLSAMIRDYEDTDGFEDNDYQEIMEKAHALKGATGNLAVTPLYNGYSDIVRLLREERPKQAKEVIRTMLPVQEEIIRCIEKYR